ncbi:MAG: AI-2E family transporter [Desulfobulbaceae bacterium]|nr:MAG: AI-2E family transporter [Desulfobulbaceae bacterium]
MILYYFLFLFLISILLVGWLIWPFLSIIIISYLLASIFRPIYLWFNRKLAPYFASLLTCSLVVLLVFIPSFFLVNALTQEALALLEWSRGAGVSLALMLREFQQSPFFIRLQETAIMLGLDTSPENIGQILAELARMVGFFFYGRATAWVANILVFILSFFIMIITIFFFFIEHDRILNYIFKLSPLPEAQKRLLVAKFDEITGAVLIGNGICAVIQGVLGGLVFFVLALGPPVLWGTIMAALAFLPVLGLGLVLIPVAILLGIQENLIGVVIVMIAYVINLVFIESLLKPKLVGDWTKAKIHILLVFFSIIGGLSTFGFLGVIYGPLILITFLTLADIYVSHYDKYVKMPNQIEPTPTSGRHSVTPDAAALEAGTHQKPLLPDQKT